MKKSGFLCVALMLAVGLLSAQAADPYKVFNSYRAAAEKGVPYPGAPLKGKRVGFANGMSSFPFCMHLDASLRGQLKLAGLDLDKGLISMDNQASGAAAIRNADKMLSLKPDVFVQYNLDAKSNPMIAERFAEAGIPLVAIDVEIPGYPVAGTNNYTVATMAGHAMARLIRQKWGGWDHADLVVIIGLGETTPHLELRTAGVAHALADEFGISFDDPKIIHAQGNWLKPAATRAAVQEVLAAHPDARRIALAGLNDEVMVAAVGALQVAGRWDPGNAVVVTMGMNETGQSLLRREMSDAGVAFLPEKYGQYVVPMIAAVVAGAPVPPASYVKNEVITRGNIDRYYPE